MFGANTPMRLQDVTFKTRKMDGEDRRIVALTLFIQPFTPEMADALNVKRRLFSVNDAEPLPDVLGCELAIAQDYQRMQVRMAPDQTVASIEIPNVEIGPALKVRKDKEGPIFAAVLRAEMAYPSPNDLMFLASRVNEQDYFTFEPEQGDMLDTSASREPALVGSEE